MTIAADIGLAGGICLFELNETIPMPTIKNEVKKATHQLDLKNGKKQFYKSGPKKGQPKMKIRSKAKFETELDIKTIYSCFKAIDGREPHTVVFEQPGTSFGNSARTTATTNRNYGKLLAAAELAECNIVTVAPHKWKADLNLTKDKLQCVEKAEELSGHSFRTPKGALKDGEAESYLIGYWYDNFGKDKNEN